MDQLRATTNTRDAVYATDLSLLCVGTPSRKNGSLDLTYLERVCEQIGEALQRKPTITSWSSAARCCRERRTSRSFPRSRRRRARNTATGFGVTVNPEFLREGTAINDFRHPPLTLVGHNYKSDAAPTEALYTNVQAPLVNDEHPDGRDDQVRQQHLARAEGLLRERNRQPVQARSRSTATT